MDSKCIAGRHVCVKAVQDVYRIVQVEVLLVHLDLDILLSLLYLARNTVCIYGREIDKTVVKILQVLAVQLIDMDQYEKVRLVVHLPRYVVVVLIVIVGVY